MKMLNKILKILKNKSNIDYNYYHLFNNVVLSLNFASNLNFTINYIVYVVDSNFLLFNEKYSLIKNAFITDVFLERLILTKEDKKILFSMNFNKLFWLRINYINFEKEYYEWLILFISKNSLDLNRLFLENIYLSDDFFCLFENLSWFWNLSFINFDNNNIWDKGLSSFIKFIDNNKINLEYLSLINNKITNFDNLFNYLDKSDIRILDLSSSLNLSESLILDFITNNLSIKELYLRNIIFSDYLLNSIYEIFLNNKTWIYNLRISLNKSQEKYFKLFRDLWIKKNINFDINFLGDSNLNIYSTIYIKSSSDKNLKITENEYFYIIDENDIDNEFKKLILNNNKFLIDWINLFLFDLNDYKKINYLISNYSFNYIYIENYYINNEDFIYFIESIRNQNHKKYKINLISIEINEFQLDYLINNFPDNIFYIEVNLNKIISNREIYISKMLKNSAFIFENLDLYKKIFKN